MRHLVQKFLDDGLSRRGFMQAMSALGFTVAAAEAVVQPLLAFADVTGGPNTALVTGTGGELCVAQVKAAGVEYLFTNPGSFEVGFFDAFTDTPGIQLIMGLHEGVVISMADGYHRVSRKPAFVNVHTIAGTAQMGGQLYNAYKDGSALVITAGLTDNQQFSDNGILTALPGFDQKEVPRQFTKIAWEARNAESIPVLLRRAFKVATTEPGGPVYLALANYALEAKNSSAPIIPAERFMAPLHMRPAAPDVERAAKWLMEAKRPLVIVGDEVWKSGAVGDVIAFAENVGLPVYSLPMSGTSISEAFRNFPNKHPNYMGPFDMSSAYVKKGPDLVVFLGAHDLGGFALPTSPELPSSAKIVRVGIDTNWMGRNYPTDLALVGGIKEAIADLNVAMRADVAKDSFKTVAKARAAEVTGLSAALRAGIVAEIRSNMGKDPMHPDELAAVLARNLAPNSIFVSENLTGRYDGLSFGHRENEMMWLGNTGFSLGWGIGAAMGAALAAPDRPVVCAIGDGSVMYSASGFWTQARYSIPVLTVIWNNHDYQTVRLAYEAYKGKMEKTGHYAGMYLGNPDIDFVKLAASQGVAGERVMKGKDLEAAVRRGVKATQEGKPYVLDVEVARFGGGSESTWYEKFSLAEKRTKKA